MAMNAPEIIEALTLLVEVFEDMEIPYYIGGSVASSLHGNPRLTRDVDIIAALTQKHILPLVARLHTAYYIDADSIQDAIGGRTSSFNLIHLNSMLKIDVFLPRPREYDREKSQRAALQTLEEGSRPFYVASLEDTVLTKLEWYTMSPSERQWGDIVGMLNKGRKSLDFRYIQIWARKLAVTELLEKALIEVGFRKHQH